MIVALLLSAAAPFSADDVRAIRTKCHTPVSWLRMRRDGAVHLVPPKDADYTKVDCILGTMRDLSVQCGYKVGYFVGNEAPEPEKPK